VKALTVRQPYAWAIATGAKTVENRSRPTKHRGSLAIHAGAAWHQAGALDERVTAAVDPWRYPHEAGQPADATSPLFVFRAVVAVVHLVDCHQADDGCCAPWGDPGCWHWVLTRPWPLPEPVPASGRLGLWDIDLPGGAA
jgi:hypothetical protein